MCKCRCTWGSVSGVRPRIHNLLLVLHTKMVNSYFFHAKVGTYFYTDLASSGSDLFGSHIAEWHHMIVNLGKCWVLLLFYQALQLSFQTKCSVLLALFTGSAQLSVTCSMEKWGEPGIFSHVRWHNQKMAKICRTNMLHFAYCSTDYTLK